MEVSVGAILEGTIKSITKFGAFVSLPGGRSGLVHISEIAHSYVADVRDFLTEGQAVKVKVVGIDEASRINLSIKKTTPPPSQAMSRNQQGDARGGGFRDRQGDARSGAPRDRQGDARGGDRRSSASTPRSNYGGMRQGSGRSASSPQAAGPADFEARLKQFMQSSDSKLSDLRMTEKRNSRRSGHH